MSQLPEEFGVSRRKKGVVDLFNGVPEDDNVVLLMLIDLGVQLLLLGGDSEALESPTPC